MTNTLLFLLRSSQTVTSYAEFTTLHNSLLESYCTCTGMSALKTMLIQHGSILLQEHASSYLLLSCLEDEMNGEREKMKTTGEARACAAARCGDWGLMRGRIITENRPDHDLSPFACPQPVTPRF